MIIIKIKNYRYIVVQIDSNDEYLLKLKMENSLLTIIKRIASKNNNHP